MSKKYGYGRREGCKGAGEREKHLRGKLAHRGQTNRNFAAGGGKAVTVVRGPAVMWQISLSSPPWRSLSLADVSG